MFSDRLPALQWLGRALSSSPVGRKVLYKLALLALARRATVGCANAQKQKIPNFINLEYRTAASIGRYKI